MKEEDETITEENENSENRRKCQRREGKVEWLEKERKGNNIMIWEPLIEPDNLEAWGKSKKKRFIYMMI